MPLFRDDPALLNAFRRGSPDALAEVYRFYSTSVERRARTLAKSTACTAFSRRSLVLDVVQETFARAFSKAARSRVDSERHYAPYLMIITRNCFVDACRAMRREVLTAPDDLLDASDIFGAEGEPYCEPKVAHALSAYIGSLSDSLKAVYEQRIVLRRSQEAACSALGLSRRKLRTAEQRLRRRLRAELVVAGVAPCDVFELLE